MYPSVNGELELEDHKVHPSCTIGGFYSSFKLFLHQCYCALVGVHLGESSMSSHFFFFFNLWEMAESKAKKLVENLS